MSRRFISAGLMMAALFASASLIPTSALAQKKKKAEDQAKKADTIDSGKFHAGEFIGLLKTTPGSNRIFDFECQQDRLVPTGNGKANVTSPHPAKPPNLSKVHQAQQKMQHAIQHGQQAQVKLASAKNPPELKKAQADMTKAQGEMNKAKGDYLSAVLQVLAQANAQTNATILATIRRNATGIPKGYKVDQVKALVEFQHTETVKVRTMVLPVEFDDKGNQKKYTKDQLATLKGKDKNLIGYESSLEKLETGQKLRVVLTAVPKKPTAKATDLEKDAEKDAPEEKDKAEKKMQVKMIVILEESKGTSSSAKGKNKK